MAKAKTFDAGRPPLDEDQKMQPISIGLPGPFILKLKNEARKRNISFSKIVREYLRKAGA